MKFYGHVNLLQNEIQAATLQTENEFPVSPTVGRVAFVNQVVYICADIQEGIPVWVPLTNEIGTYVHVQDVAASTWTITHPLNTSFVLCQTFDGNNAMFIPNEINIINATTVEVICGVAAAGRAVLVAGSLDGARKPLYALEYTQASPQSNWVINHNLGYAPIVRIFIGQAEVQPASIVHNSMNQVTISFLTPQIGVAKLI